MIELVIYHIHIVAMVYAYVQRWQREGVGGGLLAVAIIGLVFVIGWSLTGAIARLVMPEVVAGALVTSDTLSLLLLLPIEVVFFWVFFLRGEGERAALQK
jgi:hypothetical protein